MKYQHFTKFVLFVVLVSFFSACNNDNPDNQISKDVYLVTYEKLEPYSASVSQIKSVLGIYAILYPELQTIIDNASYDIEVFKITYNTQFEGKPIIASGLVSVPVADATFPVMSYQNGTNTLHSNAPTVKPDYELYKLLEYVASTGFIVSVPDYLGFGITSNMYHPYLDKQSTVETTTDMLRAVKELCNNYLRAAVKKDLYITGYSQGGWATMQLQKYIEENYGSEFDLKASSCGAGPYDLRYINNYVISQSSYPMPYFIGYIFNSYINSSDITNPAADIFKSPYSARILALYDGTKSGEEINAQLTTNTADLFTAEYLIGANTNSKFASVINSLNKNSISAWKTNIPTMIMHGTDDNYVPPQISQNMYDDFLAKGVDTSKVQYIPIPGAGHTTGIIPAGAASINWFIELKNAK